MTKEELEAEVNRLKLNEQLAVNNGKNLLKENAELKADNDARKFAMAMSGKVEKQLREENTELKEQNRNYEQLIDNGSVTLVKERLKNYKQLTKAKEIIKKLYSYVFRGMKFMELNDFNVLKAEAEQFLKDSEVEK